MPYPRLAAVKNGSNDLKFGTQSGHLKIVHAKFQRKLKKLPFLSLAAEKIVALT